MHVCALTYMKTKVLLTITQGFSLLLGDYRSFVLPCIARTQCKGTKECPVAMIRYSIIYHDNTLSREISI